MHESRIAGMLHSVEGWGGVSAVIRRREPSGAVSRGTKGRTAVAGRDAVFKFREEWKWEILCYPYV